MGLAEEDDRSRRRLDAEGPQLADVDRGIEACRVDGPNRPEAVAGLRVELERTRRRDHDKLEAAPRRLAPQVRDGVANRLELVADEDHGELRRGAAHVAAGTRPTRTGAPLAADSAAASAIASAARPSRSVGEGARPSRIAAAKCLHPSS